MGPINCAPNPVTALNAPERERVFNVPELVSRM